MVKALELVIEKVRKLPQARQERAASILEDFVLHDRTGVEEQPAKAKKPRGDWLGYMREAGGNISDAEVTADLWDPEETIREWDELMAETQPRVAGKPQQGPI